MVVFAFSFMIHTQSPRSQVKLPSRTSGSGQPFLRWQRGAISYPLFVPDTFSCKIRKVEGEDARFGIDALSKTGSLMCKDQEVSISEPERAVNADH